MAKILILETSSEKGCLVLAENEAVIEALFLSGGPELSKNLGKVVQELLARHSFSPDLVAVGTGPGSYTGVRVGAALAKALAYSWKAPVIGFCSLKGFAPSVEGPFAILTDARSAGLYALFGEKKEDGFAFQEPLLLQPDERNFQAVGCLASPHPEAVQKRGLLGGNWMETFPDPQLLAQIAYRQFLAEGALPIRFNYEPPSLPLLELNAETV